MLTGDPRNWSSFPSMDPASGTLIRPSPGRGTGCWSGAPGAAYDAAQSHFYLVYRLRHPRGVTPDRGFEVRIATGRDGVRFDDIWAASKDQLHAASLGRCSLVQRPTGAWRLYVSYVHPVDGRWQIGLIEAERPDRFEPGTLRPVLTATNIAAEGVKDPFVFRVAGLWHMAVTYAGRHPTASPHDLHAEQDVFSTGLVTAGSGLATSADGLAWHWEGPVLSPRPGEWDGFCSRVTTIWHQPPAWLVLYDGAAKVDENHEERPGLAYSFDLRRWHRATRSGPQLAGPHGGSVRYFDALALPEATYFYYELARPDGSHDLRVCRQEMPH